MSNTFCKGISFCFNAKYFALHQLTIVKKHIWTLFKIKYIIFSLFLFENYLNVFSCTPRMTFFLKKSARDSQLSKKKMFAIHFTHYKSFGELLKKLEKLFGDENFSLCCSSYFLNVRLTHMCSIKNIFKRHKYVIQTDYLSTFTNFYILGVYRIMFKTWWKFSEGFFIAVERRLHYCLVSIYK